MAALRILEIMYPGMLTSVQDLGRYGFGRFGVAPSGALDCFSLRIANLLVGNREDQACLETMLLGPGIRVLADIVIAVTGGNLQPKRNKHPIKMWRSHVFRQDDILSFEAPIGGFRAYIAVGGGVGVPPIMGSKSTNLPSGFGGQSFMPEVLEKVTECRTQFPDLDIGVDGGLNQNTIAQSYDAGANVFDAGTFLFTAPDMADEINTIRASLSGTE